MAKSVDVHVAEVMRHKGPILLPEKMTIPVAIDVLTRKAAYDSEMVAVRETVPAFPFDGALALAKALVEQFGYAMQESKPWDVAASITVATGPDSKVAVPWGSFLLPGMANAVVACGSTRADGRICFQLQAKCTHGDEPVIRKLFDRVRAICATESIYRGRAFGVRFTDTDGDVLGIPDITFMAPKVAPVIFRQDLERAIQRNLLTVIQHADKVKAAGIPIKRGVLLAGPYGTGKTLVANMVAGECIANGWTFVYVRNDAEFAHALRFARDYQPAVVFVEDIDRSAGPERTDAVNEILNTLDGIDSKAADVVVVLTSNHADMITEAMRRPGRIDVTLGIEPPDAEAAARLLRLYGRNLIDPKADLAEVGCILDGRIPAVIREVVERAKLEAIRRSGGASLTLTAADLEVSALELVKELALFAPKPKESQGAALVEKLGASIGGRIGLALKDVASMSNGHPHD